MALIGTLRAGDKHNAYCEDIKGAYFRVVAVNIDTEKEKVRVQVRGWMSEYARHNQGIGIFKRVFYIDLSEFKNVKCAKDSLVKRAYECISKFPEFDGCRNSMKKYSGKIDITPEKAESDKQELDDLIREMATK